MNGLHAITGITVLSLVISLVSDYKAGLGTTPVSAALLLSVVLLLGILIMAGPLKLLDAAQMEQKTPVAPYTVPRGGLLRPLGIRNSLPIRLPQNEAQASRQLAGRYYMKLEDDPGTVRADREWTRIPYRISSVGKRDHEGHT